MRNFKEILLKIEESINNISSQANKDEAMLYFDKLPVLETNYDFKKEEYVNTSTKPTSKNRAKFVYKVFEKDDKTCFSIEYYVSNSKLWGAYKKEKSFNFYVSDKNEIYYAVSQFYNEKELKNISYKFQNGELIYIRKFTNNPHKSDIIETELSKKTENAALGSKIYTSKANGTTMVIKYDVDLREKPHFSLELLNSKYASQRIIPNKTKTALK